jgi:hypothetical protein
VPIFLEIAVCRGILPLPGAPLGGNAPSRSCPPLDPTARQCRIRPSFQSC